MKPSKKKNWRDEDKFLSREQGLYDNPIPSREYLMAYVAEQSRFMTAERLVVELGISGDGIEGLERRLSAMVRDGQLIRNRRDGYGPVSKLDLIKGRVIGHPDGYGFVIPDEGGDDLYLTARQMRQLMHGDKGLFSIAGIDRRGRREGQLVEVLERNTSQVVGRFLQENNINLVVPDNLRVQHEIQVAAKDCNNAKPGQIVVAELLQQPSRRARPTGRIVEILGDHMGPGMEIDIAIRAHDIPFEWPEQVIREVEKFGVEVPHQARRGRLDLRDMPLVTIDGPDAKDFDDAVYCEKRKDSWKLYVAIADVSAYVKPGSALDKEAKARGTSVYFLGRVVPMLPEALSNGLCSLNPHVDRLCMVCEMTIDKSGHIKRSVFHEAVMNSAARLTYDEVAGVLNGKDKTARKQYAHLVGHLEALHALYRVLDKARKRRGAIEFESNETTIVFGRSRKIERIDPVERNVAHKIIEECMIAANVAAARQLMRKHMPALYRIHEPPKTDKLTDLKEFLRELGLRLRGGMQPQPADYAKLSLQIAERPDARLIQTVMLRSMNQAVYSPDNIGHFGLAHENYAHFTSPIRRYPDLLVHRAIRHLIRKGSKKQFFYDKPAMLELGEHCSMCERRADDATRDAMSWLKCEYMMDKVGETFSGIISSVTSFGLFVELDDIYVEGLIHVTSLKNDYYHFEPAHHRLVGERTGTSYRLGNPILVRVVRVDLDERKIDFDEINTDSPGKGKKKGKKSGKGKSKKRDKQSHRKREKKSRGRRR